MNALTQSGQQAARGSQDQGDLPASELTAAQTIRPVEGSGGGPKAGRVSADHAASPAPGGSGKLSYDQGLKQELGAIIDQLDLSELQKRCLRSRWLDAVTWMESKAKVSQRRYYLLRLTTIIGGVIIPALVSLDLGGEAQLYVRSATFIVSLLVAISAAVEGFFRFGERWRHYRPIVERLKIEGWQFFQLSGPYAQAGGHGAAYPSFAAQVEAIVQSDVETYVAEIVREKQERKD